jgi:hypothetical protein
LNFSSAALEKLTRLFGQEKGHEVFRQTLEELGLQEIKSPDEELLFGNALLEFGGLLSIVGRSINANAFLRGAKRPEATARKSRT